MNMFILLITSMIVFDDDIGYFDNVIGLAFFKELIDEFENELQQNDGR